MNQSGFVVSYKKYRSTMSCAIVAFCLDFLRSQYDDCLDSTCLFNNCLDLASFNYTFPNCTSSNYTSSNYTSPNCTSLNIFTNYTCVDSCQINCSSSPSPQSPDFTGFVSFNVVMLLAVVLPVVVVDTVILVALALESSIVKVIRLVLASILISGLLNGLGLIMYHIAGIVLSYSFPVNAPPSQPCTITVFLLFFGAAARLVFMTTISIVVYIIIKHSSATKKHLVVAVFVAVVVLWVITFLGASPVLSQEFVHTDYELRDTQYYCIARIGTSELSTYIFWGMYLFFFCVVTSSVAVVFLLIICCNRRSFTSATAVEKTLVKFGFFLLLGSGLNMIGIIVPFMISITSAHYVRGAFNEAPERLRILFYAAFTLVIVGLIPTPILILIFFKSIRKWLLHWLCCCMAKKRKAKHNHNNDNNNNGEGRMVTATV